MSPLHFWSKAELTAQAAEHAARAEAAAESAAAMAGRRAALVARIAPLRMDQAAWILRFGDGLTLDEIGSVFDLTRERVRQLTLRLEWRAWWAAQCLPRRGREPAFMRRLRAAGCLSGLRRWGTHQSETEARQFSAVVIPPGHNPPARASARPGRILGGGPPDSLV
jgi:hypothetical protein